MTEALLERLKHPQLSARTAATEQLVALGPVAVPRLMEVAAASPNPTVRVRALEALGRIGDFRALPLFLRLERSTDLDVASAARKARHTLHALPIEQQSTAILTQLTEGMPTVTLISLVEFVREDDARFSLELKATLRRVCEKLTVAPDDPWNSSFQEAQRYLVAATPESPLARPSLALPQDAESLVRFLNNADYGLRTAAANRLALLGEEALPAMQSGLVGASYLTRIRIFAILGKLSTPKALPLLLQAYESYPSERMEVLKALIALVPILEGTPFLELFESYLQAIRLFRYEPTGVAVAAARALVSLAQSEPSPRYRTAVPLLKARFFAPPLAAGLVPLGKELDRLTAPWKDLPLVSEGPATSADLPLASEKDSPARD